MRSISLALIAGLLIGWLAPACAQTPPQPSAREQVKQLAALLSMGVPQKEKADACRELARIGTSDAVAALAALLADEKLSHMARYGLETIPGPAPDKALRQALDQLHGRPLVGVIGSIGVRRDPKAVTPLLQRLQDPDPEIVQAAARALGKIGPAVVADTLQSALPTLPVTNQLAYCEALLACAETLALHGDPKHAVAIYDNLRALPTPHQVHAAALRGAVLSRQADGLAVLLETLSTEDPALFAAAMRVAQELPGSQVTAALATQLKWLPAQKLKWLPDQKQILLVQTLGKRADAAALPDLFVAARTGHDPVRVAVLRALPEIGHPSAVPVFVELLADPAPDVARAAQDGLAALPGKEADDAVVTLAGRGSVDQRILGMDLAARRRVLSVVSQLFISAEDLQPRIRVAALKKIGELLPPVHLPALMRVFERARPEDAEVAGQALTAVCLRTGDSESCVRMLTNRFSQARISQQCAMLSTLGTLGGPKALQAVRAALRASEADVHTAAVRALACWNNPEVAPDLLRLLRSGIGPTEQALCLRGYLRFAAQPDLAASNRLALCREAVGVVQDENDKKRLLAVLGNLHSLDSLALVQPYLDDPATKEEAATATVIVAEKLLQDPNAPKLAPNLLDPLDKAAQSTTNTNLAKRAQTLLTQARAKSPAKQPAAPSQAQETAPAPRSAPAL